MTTHDDDQAARDLRTIERALSGDERAREALAQRLGIVRQIVQVLNGRAGSSLRSDEIDDVCQDVQRLVWEKIRLFQGVGSLEAWLYRFCVFAFRSRRRRSSRWASSVESLPEEPAIVSSSDDDAIDTDALQRALRELGPPSEEIVRMKHEDGLSFEAIAERLNIPSSTAKTRYYEGIRWLRERLSRGRGARA